MDRWFYALVGALLGLALLVGCGQGTASESSDSLNVTVSILPQKYFVERLGGERVSVNVMVLPGESPATYEPKPRQIEALSRADAYVRIRVPFEKAWMDRIAAANPDMKVVDTTEGIERRGGAENPDPHIWLSPRLVKVQLRTICDALIELDPAYQEVYSANLESFVEEVDALDAYTREALAGVENRTVMVFHPSWGYFAHDYGLEMIPIEIGGQEPSAAELADLIATAREKHIRVIFAQPQFSARAAETIASGIDGEVLLIDPLAPDWLDNMRRVAATFAEVLE